MLLYCLFYWVFFFYSSPVCAFLLLYLYCFTLFVCCISMQSNYLLHGSISLPIASLSVSSMKLWPPNDSVQLGFSVSWNFELIPFHEMELINLFWSFKNTRVTECLIWAETEYTTASLFLIAVEVARERMSAVLWWMPSLLENLFEHSVLLHFYTSCALSVCSTSSSSELKTRCQSGRRWNDWL